MNFLAPYKLYAFAGLVIIITAILTLHLLADNRLQKKYDALVIEFKDFKSAIDTATKVREVEIANKRLAGLAKMQLIEAEYEAEVKKLGITASERDRLKKELQNERNNIATALNHAYELRVQTAGHSAGMPEVSPPTVIPTESGGDCDATIARTVIACQDTTLAYNSLYESWEGNCLVYGCEPIIGKVAIVGRDE